MTFLRYVGGDWAVVRYVGVKDVYEMTVPVSGLREIKKEETND